MQKNPYITLKYVIAILALLIGIGFIITAGVMKAHIGEGREKIAQSRGNVDAMKRLSNVNKYTATAGEIVGDQAERHIRKGETKADRYERVSNWFMTIGILLVAFSVLAFIILFRSRR